MWYPFVLFITWCICVNGISHDFETANTYEIRKEDALTDLSEEKRLARDLQLKYARLGVAGRPVKNTSEPVNVVFGLGLIKMELEEKNNMLTMSTWARYKWRDAYLEWDPADYGGLSSVKLPNDVIWTPDIMLYNTAVTDEGERKVLAVVSYDGTVMWYPHKVFYSSCAVDVRNFPFDNQTCHLWFGSWTHHLLEVDLDLAFEGGIDLSTFKAVYKDASEWEIANCTAERIVMPPEGGSQFAILSFSLHLRRKMTFSTYILTMPAIFLSFLTLLVFWLPPEHADKSALGLTIFGSLLLLLLILMETAPPTASAVPLLGLYYCFTTVIVIVSIFLSCLVLKVGRSGAKRRPVPRWVRVLILDLLGRLMCYTPSRCFVRRQSISKRAVHLNGLYDLCERDIGDPRDLVIGRDTCDDVRLNGAHPSAMIGLERRLRSLHHLLADLVKRQGVREEAMKREMDVEEEWRRVALVLDRLFFTIYFIVIIISLLLLFPNSPMSVS